MNILAIGAHPDDIEYACGGTLLKHSEHGDSVYLLVMSDGEAGGDPRVRRREQEASARIMGAKHVFWGGEKDTQMLVTKEMIDRIEAVIAEVRPTLIFVHNPSDTHQDHRALTQATLAATRYVRNVLFCAGPTSFNFDPCVFTDIEPVLEKKMDLLRAHASQVEKTNIQGLTIVDMAHASAVFRGVEARVRYAEGFVPVRLFLDGIS